MNGNSDFVIESGVLMKYNGPGGDVVIPADVVEISYYAFSNCTGLTAVTIPEGITKIGAYAFQGTGLVSLTIPGSVMEIGFAAFSDCVRLRNVIFSEGVTEIKNQAFSDCTALTRVALPASMTNVDGDAFCGCTSLSQVEIAPKNPAFFVENGLVLTMDGQAVVFAPAAESITVPESVTELAPNAFFGRKNLTHVTLPDGLTYLEKHAFHDCTGLTSIVIPAGVKVISWGAFQNCTSLASVTILGPVTRICDYAFSGCENLTEVHIPDTVTSIGKYAFEGCSSIRQLRLPPKLKKINEGLCSDCDGLEEVVIPEKVTEIGLDAFQGCALQRVTLLGKRVEMEVYPFGQEKNFRLFAPNLSITELKPVYRENAIRGFLHQEGEMFSAERRADYLSYIKTNYKKLSPLALEEPELLRLMLEEKMLTPKAAEQMAVQAAQESCPEAAVQLLDYQNKIFPMEKRLEAEKRRLQRQAKKMEQELNLLEGGGEPQPKQPKLWRYEKDEKGNLTLLGYKGEETDVEVPAAIDGLPVTAIGDYAFSPNGKPLPAAQRETRRKIRSIRIPEGILTIGTSAFENCESLERVYLPASVQKIAASSYLTDDYKPKLKKSDNPFRGCMALREVIVAEGNRWYSVRDGLLFRKSRGGDKMLGYAGDPQGRCIIPEGTQEIPSWFFQSCHTLKNVILPNSLTKIGAYAFCDCENLTSVTIPVSTTEIGPLAFRQRFVGNLPQLTIHAPAGSCAEQYAKFDNIPFQPIEE